MAHFRQALAQLMSLPEIGRAATTRGGIAECPWRRAGPCHRAGVGGVRRGPRRSARPLRPETGDTQGRVHRRMEPLARAYRARRVYGERAGAGRAPDGRGRAGAETRIWRCRRCHVEWVALGNTTDLRGGAGQLRARLGAVRPGSPPGARLHLRRPRSRRVQPQPLPLQRTGASAGRIGRAPATSRRWRSPANSATR